MARSNDHKKGTTTDTSTSGTMKRHRISASVLLLVLAVFVRDGFGYRLLSPQRQDRQHASQQLQRRDIFRTATLLIVSTTAAATPSQPANAVLSSKYCASGVGDGCDDLAGDNPLVKRLQQQSAANRETNERVRLVCMSRKKKNTRCDATYAVRLTDDVYSSFQSNFCPLSLSLVISFIYGSILPRKYRPRETRTT